MLDIIARIGLLIFTETPEVAGQSSFTPTPDSSVVNTGAPAQLPLSEEPIETASSGPTIEPIVGPYFVDAQGVQTPIETYTVKLDDGGEATIEELRQGNLRQADYTRKTQDLAEERARVEAWRVYYQQKEQDPQAVVNPQNVAPQTAPSGFDALTDTDYATDTERHLATELRNTRGELTQVNERMAGYDTRLANNEAANADAQLTSSMTQWSSHFNVTEEEILAIHSETGVSNVKVLAEIANSRKQASAVPMTQQVAQTVAAAASTQVVAQRPQATQQPNEIKIDFTKPVGQRLDAIQAKYPNMYPNK